MNNNESQRTHVMSITSGKGGVGKTTITANIAVELGKRGERVLLLDGDLGMSNLDIMFNVRPQLNLYDVVRGEVAIEEILIEVAPNVTLIPGGSGIYELSAMSHYQRQNLLDQVSALGGKFSTMLIDTSPGIDNNVLYLNGAAQQISVVVTPDPSSIADSYAIIKVLNQRARETRFSIICNQVKNESDGLGLFQRFDNVVQKFLHVRLDYMGSIPMDLNLKQATRAQQLITQSHQTSTSAQALVQIVNNNLQMRSRPEAKECKGNLQFFWKQLLGVAS